jgi:hypothetical protein
MFILPVIFHATHYRKFDVERVLHRNKQYALIGIVSIALAMYFALGLALNSKLPVEIAYSLSSLPFILIIIIFFRVFRHAQD